MDRAKFFAALRSTAPRIFGNSLSEPQVRGIEAILDACQTYRVTSPHHIANILAQVFHETGGYMSPIKETVMPHHKDKNPSDTTVIARLDKAFKAGQLSWVKTPYWRDGWFGRGPIQTTHKRNYEVIGKAIGVDLIKDRDRIMEPAIGAASAVVGMRDGLYTGKKLSDFNFPGALNADTRNHPRRIVNGNDGTDAKINGYHRFFHEALMSAGYRAQPYVVDDPGVRPSPAPAPSTPAPDAGGKVAATAAVGLAAAIAAWWSDISSWIGGLFQ